MSFKDIVKHPFRSARYARLRHEHKARANKHRVPYSHCCNCGQQLHGTYCHNCGQYARDITPTVASFVGQYFENSFQWDGKFFRTIRTLFVHPGRLSVAWVDGHVARYVFPLKLYMFVMVIFGFIMLATLNHNSESGFDKKPKVAVSDQVIKQKIEQSQVLDSTSFARVNELLSSKSEIVDGSMQIVQNSMINALSRLPLIFMFAMPFFAVIMRWMYRRRYKQYIPHLVFAIHIHTFFFIVATAEILART